MVGGIHAKAEQNKINIHKTFVKAMCIIIASGISSNSLSL